jgi:signal transduction histidine kinase
VSIQRDGKDVKCTVSDRGAGIPAQHLPFIFERFYRAESSRKRHSGGTGLGLAIVRSLVLAQGGRVLAESQEGRGTSLSFWLPGSENCHPID